MLPRITYREATITEYLCWSTMMAMLPRITYREAAQQKRARVQVGPTFLNEEMARTRIYV